MTARLLDISAAEYFADPGERPTLTQSIAHTLVTKTPAHAYLEHPRLGGGRDKATAALKSGSLIDALILGGWERKVGIVEFDDFKKKDAQAERDALAAAGKLAVTRPQFHEAQDTAGILTDKLASRGFRFTGKSQAVILWTEESTSGPVECRAMLDHVFIEEGVIWDLKTIHEASTERCAAHTYDYGHDIQRAAYSRALDRLMESKRFGGPDFVFLFCEIHPPYCITPSRLDGQFRMIGERRWETAVETWGRCLRANEWPEYAAKNEVVRLEPRPWVVARELGA